MKLLHKQLLTVCLPYVLLILTIWIVQLEFVEPAERERIREAAQRELKVHSESIHLAIERTIHQLELLALHPDLRVDDLTVVAAKLPQLSGEQTEQFATLQLHALNVPGARSQLVNSADEARLNEGHPVVTDFLNVKVGLKPHVSVIIPVTTSGDSPAFALIGEVKLVELFPWLDPKLNFDWTAYALADSRGLEMTAASIQPIGTAATRTPAPIDWWSQWNSERFSVQVPPWNWTVHKTVYWPRALRAVRFQRNLWTALGLLALLTTAAVVIWLNRTTNSRLSNLIETIQVFGATNPALRAADDRPDEIGRLAETFNCMADDVAHTQRRLQKQLDDYQQTVVPSKDRVRELEIEIGELQRYADRMAHEFKGPLVTLDRFASQLTASAKSGNWQQFDCDQARVKSIGRQLQDVSGSLLQLTKTVRTSEPISFHAAATEAGELLALPPDRLQISDSLPMVRGDAVLWRHVFTNLLQNAIQSNSPHIEVGCETRQGETMCYVRDHGRGMTSDELADIFHQPGIGLTLVRRIVEHHGGRIWAESSGPGTGSSIYWTVV